MLHFKSLHKFGGSYLIRSFALGRKFSLEKHGQRKFVTFIHMIRLHLSKNMSSIIHYGKDKGKFYKKPI